MRAKLGWLLLCVATVVVGCAGDSIDGDTPPDDSVLGDLPDDAKNDGVGRTCDKRYVSRGCDNGQVCKDYDGDGVGHCVAWFGAACDPSDRPDPCPDWYPNQLGAHCSDGDRDGVGHCVADTSVCESNDDCSSGKVCADYDDDGRAHCVAGDPPCSSNAECASEKVCRDFDGDGVRHCAPVSCSSTSQCASGETCQDTNRDHHFHCEGF